MKKYLYLTLLVVPAVSHAMQKGKAKAHQPEVVEVALTFVKPGAQSPKHDEPKQGLRRRLSLPSLFGKSSHESGSSAVSKNSTNSISSDYASVCGTPRAGTPKSPKNVHFDEKRNSVQEINIVDGERESYRSPRVSKRRSALPFLSPSKPPLPVVDEEAISFSYYVGSESDIWHEAAQQAMADSKQKEASATINQLAIAVQATKISSKHADDDHDDESFD